MPQAVKRSFDCWQRRTDIGRPLHPKGIVASKGAEDLVRHSDGQGGLIPEEESLRYHRPDLVQKALATPE